MTEINGTDPFRDVVACARCGTLIPADDVHTWHALDCPWFAELDPPSEPCTCLCDVDICERCCPLCGQTS